MASFEIKQYSVVNFDSKATQATLLRICMLSISTIVNCLRSIKCHFKQ